MAKINNIRPGVEVKFTDGPRTIYPLTLRQLRKINTIMKSMESSENDDESVDLMVEAAAIILEKIDPEVVSDPDTLEDILDIKSFNEMIAAAMGTDPNA